MYKRVTRSVDSVEEPNPYTRRTRDLRSSGDLSHSCVTGLNPQLAWMEVYPKDELLVLRLESHSVTKNSSYTCPLSDVGGRDERRKRGLRVGGFLFSSFGFPHKVSSGVVEVGRIREGLYK